MVLTREKIKQRQQSAIKHIQNILSHIPPASIRILLRYYNWDSQKLLEAYSTTETDDLPSFFTKIGLCYPEDENYNEKNEEKNEENNNNKLKQSSNSFGSLTCRICSEEFNIIEAQTELVAPPCGHLFCRDCWRAYLTVEVVQQHHQVRFFILFSPSSSLSSYYYYYYYYYYFFLFIIFLFVYLLFIINRNLLFILFIK